MTTTTIICSGAELIHAKVPILKFRDVRNGLQVDLNCNNVVGIRNTDMLIYFSRRKFFIVYLFFYTNVIKRK